MRGTSSSFAETPLFFIASHQFSILLTLKYRLHRDTFSKSSFPRSFTTYSYPERKKRRTGIVSIPVVNVCRAKTGRLAGTRTIGRNANDWQDRCNWIKRWRRMTRRCELARSTRIGAERSGEDEAPARGEPAIRKIFKPIGWYF